MNEDFEPLLGIAEPDLYRRNGFRMTELPVDCRDLDFSKRQQMVEAASRTGFPLPSGPCPVLATEQGKDPDAVREAVQRLRDPVQRLMHEFFWFWPHKPGGSRTDKALLSLAQSDANGATDIWHQEEQERSETYVSTHNLAVLRHLSALEWELLALTRPLTEEEKRYTEACWVRAFRRWKVLLEHEAFWGRLKDRICELKDARLTADTARAVRQTLPMALLMINARLALYAAERGDASEARRHIAMLRKWEETPGEPSGIGEDQVLPPLADGVLRRTLEPIRERIKHACKTAEQEASEDPGHAHEASRRLLKHAKPLLAIVDCLFPLHHPTYDALHDEVALAGLQCQVAYGNKTNDWDTVAELLQEILTLTASENARKRVLDNLDTVEKNRESQRCWFCQVAKGDDDCAMIVKMHGEINRIPTFQGVRVTWKQVSCKVPRCASCKRAHAQLVGFKGNRGGSIAGITGVIICGEIGLIASFPNNIIAVVTGSVAFAITILGAIYTFMRLKEDTERKFSGIRPESAYVEYPVIKEMIKKGWHFGESPDV